MSTKNSVVFLVDTTSFPVRCPELQDFLSLVAEAGDLEMVRLTPTAYFKKALEFTEDYELVVPVTRNLFIRDKLRMEGVNLIVCL